MRYTIKQNGDDPYGDMMDKEQAHRTFTLALIALRDAGHLTLASELAKVAEYYEKEEARK
jgi:predicted alpha/beta hydrolase family esterase